MVYRKDHDMIVAVLGRGESLKRYPEFYHLFDKVYICGRFHKEIKKMGIKYFKGKEIVHVASRSSSPLRGGYYEKLNVSYIQTAHHSIEKQFIWAGGKRLYEKYPKNIELRTVPEPTRNRGYPPLECDEIEKYCSKFDDYKELCSFLERTRPDKIKKNGKRSRRTRHWPTIGIFAFDVAVSENKDIEKLYLFGMDVYTTLSYVMYKNIGEEYYEPIEDEKTRLSFYHIFQVVKEFPLVEFYSVSKSEKFKFNLPNWHLI